MQLGSNGARVLRGGIVVFIAGYAFTILAVPYGNLVTGAGVAGIAIGAAALCASPWPPFTGRVTRVGLGILAVGAASLLIAAVIANTMTSDPLESMPVVVLGFAGILLIPVGFLLTAIGLLRRTTSRP
jgi:hypothetical protein